MQIKAYLLREEPIPDWLADGSKFGETGFGLAIDQATVQVSNLRQYASSVLMAAPSPAGTFVDDLYVVIEDAHASDAMLKRLMSGLTAEWAYTIGATKPSEDQYYGSRAYVYTSLGHAAIWNRLRALRLLVNDTLVKVYERLALCGEQLPPMSVESTLAKIQVILKDICASVPQYFGYVASTELSPDSIDQESSDNNGNALSINLLTFSLLIAVNVTGISDGQKKWLKDRLAEVGRRANRSVLRAVASRS